MKLAPIALFVYARLDHTKRTICALKQNNLAKESDLFIFSDGPKDLAMANEVKKVREYLRSINGFKSVTIFESATNKGLASSIITGVTKIVNRYGKVIVLEDDLVTSPYFISFINDALDLYKNNLQVTSISGYAYPINDLPEIFFLRGADCWGWATWKRGWDLFEPDGKKLLSQIEKKSLSLEFDYNNSYPFTQMLRDQIDGKNNSWAIRWVASNFLKNKLILYPGRSLVRNIGNDSSGVHNKQKTTWLDSKLIEKPLILNKIEITESPKIRKKFETFFKFRKSLIGRIWLKIISLFNGD
ncbi:MAG: glycosyltransferase family 2 protein [archaeon]